METGSRWWAGPGLGDGIGELGARVSVGEDEQILETSSGDGCKTLEALNSTDTYS